MRLLDTLFTRKIPVGPDAPDADAPDAFYRHPVVRPQQASDTPVF